MAEPVTEVCLAGWSQVSRYPGEPLAAWAEALRATGVDPARLDSLDVVYCQSWPYDDPPRRLADAVGASPRRLHYSGIGGTTPLVLIAEAAERIAAGQADVCAIVAGEALATVRALKKAGQRPAWSDRDPDRKPFPFEAPFHPSEVAHGVFQAYSTFAMRDVARRASTGIGVVDHRRSLGELFAPMTAVAAANPHAWFREEQTPAEVSEATPENRLVAFPYTKRLVAVMDVDLASAVVVASPDAAAAMRLPKERRVAVMGWGRARDPDYVAEHADLAGSPGMAAALQGALRCADLSIDDVAHLDLYSCFPSSVSFALDALGLDATDSRAPFTVTGGLPYAGGPGSGYALGAVAAMADRLVQESGATAMVTGVGMHLSRHAAVVLGSRAAPFGGGEQAEPVSPTRVIADHHDGSVEVAAYTVHHGPDGMPTEALLVCDVDRRTRCYAKATQPDLLLALEVDEWVGRRVDLVREGDVNMVEA